MASFVLDASALLVMLKGESGGEKVIEALMNGAAMSAVNLSEVVAKLSEGGMPEDEIHNALDPLELDIVVFDNEHAYRAGLLRPLTKKAGLSLGDRACLALTQQLRLPVLTADRAWDSVASSIGVTVQVIQ